MEAVVKKLIKWLGDARREVALALGLVPVAVQVAIVLGAVPQSTGARVVQVAATVVALLTGSPVASSSK